MSDRSLQRLYAALLVLGLVFDYSYLSAKSSRDEKNKPDPRVKLRGEAQHVVMRVDVKEPAINQWVKVSGELRGGDLGNGNVFCLTPAWMVDAEGVNRVDETQCDSSTFVKSFRFEHEGAYRIRLIIRSHSGRIVDWGFVEIQVGGK